MAQSSSADRPHSPASEPPVNSKRAPRAARGVGESRSKEQPAEQVEERLDALDVEVFLRNLRGSDTDGSPAALTSSPLAEATLDECGCPLPGPPVVADRAPQHECSLPRHAL